MLTIHPTPASRYRTATQTALNLKAPLANPVFTGDPQAPTPTTADNDTSIATTAFVKAQGYSTTAAADANIAAKAVRYDASQGLTAAQQLQGRQNIYAAPFDAMAYSGMQINGGMEVSQENGLASSHTSWQIRSRWLARLLQRRVQVLTLQVLSAS